MNPPPHLPPKTCSIKAHQRMQLIPWVLFVVAIATLASAAIALSVIAWFLPLFSSHVETRYAFRDTHVASETADPLLVRYVSDRTVELYDKRFRIDETYYPQSAYLGTAAIISSDGWVVLNTSLATVPLGSIEGFDSTGQRYRATERVVDPVTNLVYVQLRGDSFRVIPFRDWDGKFSQDQLWSVEPDGKWHPLFVTQRQRGDQFSQHISFWRPEYVWQVSPETEVGRIVVDDRGSFAGFVTKDNYFVPVWLVTNQISHLLEDGGIEYNGFPYEARLVRGGSSEGEPQVRIALYIDRSPYAASSSTLGVGDVVHEINGEVVNPFLLAQIILTGSQTVEFLVTRDGQKYQILSQRIRVGGT